MRVTHRWRPEELDTLVKHYRTSTIHELEAMLPGRSRVAIWGQGRSLGLKQDPAYFRGQHLRAFSPAETELLKVVYPTARFGDIRRAFPGRTAGEVVEEAKKLGLEKDPGVYDASRVFTDDTVIGGLPEREQYYIAGLFDGEGSFSLVSRRAEQGSDRMYFKLIVTITNTNIEVLEWLTLRIHSSIFEKPGEGRRRMGYRWVISGDERGRVFAQEIAPMLIIKRAEAELVAQGWKHLPYDEQCKVAQQLRDLKGRLP